MKLKIDINIIFIPLIIILIWISSLNINAINSSNLSNNFSIISGNSGGTYYYIAAGQSKIINEEIGLNVLTQASSGSPVENLALVANDSQNLAIVTIDGYYFGKNGEKDRGFNKKIDNIEVLQIGHKAYLYALTMEKKEIKSFKNIEGLNIGVPPIGSSTYYMALAILEAYGYKEKNINIIPLSSQEQSEALKDGEIDIAFIAGGLSQSTVMDLDFSNKIKFLSLEKEVQEKLNRDYPYWQSSVIPQNTYKNLKEDIYCLSVNTMLVCNKDIDEKISYNITKVLNENTEKLGNIHISGFEWSKENTRKFLNNKILKFNLGAIKYYDEVFKSGL